MKEQNKKITWSKVKDEFLGTVELPLRKTYEEIMVKEQKLMSKKEKLFFEHIFTNNRIETKEEYNKVKESDLRDVHLLHFFNEDGELHSRLINNFRNALIRDYEEKKYYN